MTQKIYTNEAHIVSDEKTDYLNYVSRTSTAEQRRKFNIGDIFINGAVCLNCHDFIRSKNRHNYVLCSCGKVGVDGGSWYAKRVGEQRDRVDVIEKFYK